MNTLRKIVPLSSPPDVCVDLPGSKSITNRALLIAALCQQRVTISHALDSEDTQVMRESLRRLGFLVEQPQSETIVIYGEGGRIPAREAELWVANAGTAARFLTALVALGEGTYRIDGTPRMRQRPVQPLLDALNALGAEAVSELGTGCPPVLVRARGLRGGKVSMRGDISSQFLSALMMVSPRAEGSVTIHIEGELVSAPFVQMTLRMMRQFGVDAVWEEEKDRIVVPAPQRYRLAGEAVYPVEPDATAASYFFAAAAITGGRVCVRGLSRDSLQGDIRFVDILEQMGCSVRWLSDAVEVTGTGVLHGVDVNMSDISDTFITLAVVAPFADSPTRIRGVEHARYQESNRVSAVATELRRLGVDVEEHIDGLTIYPGTPQGGTVQTYNDHRIAMAFAIIGLRVPGIAIANPECVQKTFPNFFEKLHELEGDAP
ncbi:MAG: 3-phosphoshikimate 1-carboxyvinyltransferase [Armatimonadota bacterium]|nr:MAG: 3-phosphoshikimate 1-carboxyvinyltransferase [Armatimonadota bacterium]